MRIIFQKFIIELRRKKDKKKFIGELNNVCEKYAKFKKGFHQVDFIWDEEQG